MSFNFGVPKTTPGFTLPSTTPSTASLGGAGDTKTPTKPAPALFGAPSSTPPAFSLGTTTTPKSTPSLSFSITGASAASVAPAATLSFTSTPASSASAPQFNLGASAPTTTSAAVPSFAAKLETTSTGAAVTSASTPLKLTSLAPAATTSAPLTLTASTAQLAPATSSATSVSSIPATSTLTYAQLEDSINKWTIDLEEQGKFFINQAKQLNAWDKLLVSNSEKILNLNETIERVKEQQKQLDQELDFVLAQQNELDELSLPLEKQLADIPIADQNRFQMYQLSEIVDSQLKQMSEDLKEIVEHLNESNKNEDNSDPVVQISRILNAHMNSLQWVDRNTSQIGTHLEQISKLNEVYKRNHLNL